MKRIPQLDGLRGVAVLMVFAFHAYGIPLLWSGVDLFFVLSGYLITGILLHLKTEFGTAGYWSRFYLRRLLRIAPPYLGFLAVLSVLFPIPWHRLWYWYAFFGANLGTALGRCDVHAMIPLWSLAMEEQFYFVWPWVVLLSSQKTLRRIALGIMIAAPALRAVCTPLFSGGGYIYYLTPFRSDLLACGCWIAICTAQDQKWIERRRGISVLTLVASGMLLAGLSVFPGFRKNANTEFFNTLGFSLIVIFFGATLVWALGMTHGFWRGLLASPPLRYMGRISYTFYLYQVAVLDKLGQHLHSHLEVVLLGFILTFLFSAFSWHFIESRILKLKWEIPRTKLNPRPL